MLTVSYVDPKSDRIDRITDATSGQVLFGYDSSGRLHTITDAANRTSIVNIDGFGDLLKRYLTWPSLIMTTTSTATFTF